MTLPILQLEFDANGEAMDGATPQLENLNGVTDLIVLAHGFHCEPADATRLYTDLLANLTPQLPTRQFAIAGVYWPSEKFQESFTPPDTATVLAKLGDGKDDPTEGLPLLHKFSGSELLERLHGDVDTLLNFLTFIAMKNLAGKVGANGLALAVAKLSGVRIHLIGHSLGARLVTACCKALAEQNAEPVASLSLLEAAFSHFGFSPEGYFRNVIESRIVKGPMISTFSRRDLVVGKAYAVASRLAHDNLTAIGDSTDPYGGIGHNGAQRTVESRVIPLQPVPQPYAFEPGIVTCLDGSAGLITSHGDITNPNVTWAIASAIKGTA